MGHNGWSYEIENKNIFHKIEKSKIVSQHVKKVQTTMVFKGKISSSKLAKSQELTSYFKSHLM
jgi:hypothetical protein